MRYLKIGRSDGPEAYGIETISLLLQDGKCRLEHVVQPPKLKGWGYDHVIVSVPDNGIDITALLNDGERKVPFELLATPPEQELPGDRILELCLLRDSQDMSWLLPILDRCAQEIYFAPCNYTEGCGITAWTANCMVIAQMDRSQVGMVRGLCQSAKGRQMLEQRHMEMLWQIHKRSY